MSDTPEVKAFKEAALKCNEKNIEMMSLMLEWDSMSDEEKEVAYEKLEKYGEELHELEDEMDKKYAAVEVQGESDGTQRPRTSRRPRRTGVPSTSCRRPGPSTTLQDGAGGHCDEADRHTAQSTEP